MKALIAFLIAATLATAAFAADAVEYKLLATNRTSTMEKELNEAAAAGYRLDSTIGGDVSSGEIITVMRKVQDQAKYHYKLLATNRTGTMQRELQEAANEGYDYAGYTARGEVMVILERDDSQPAKKHYDYKLLATSRTSTMQKDLDAAAAEGFEFVAVIRRGEVLTFLRKKAS